MSNRLLVATRKGLFTLDRDGSNSWSIASTDFARRQRVDGAGRRARRPHLCRARSRPLRRQAASPERHGHMGGMRRACLSTAAGRADRHRSHGPHHPLDHRQAVGAGAGRRRPARTALVRHASRRPVPLERSRHELGAGPPAVGQSQAQGMVRRRLRRAGHPFHLRRSARLARGARRRFVRRRLDHARRRRDLELRLRGHAGRLHAAREECTTPTARMRIAWCSVPVRRTRFGCSITTASSIPPTAARAGASART